MNPNGNITGIERFKKLVDISRKNLRSYKNVEVVEGNAFENLKKEKYHRILASASFNEIPQEIINQNLRVGGRMVFPIKDNLVVVEKTPSENKINYYHGFKFVPMVGGK